MRFGHMYLMRTKGCYMITIRMTPSPLRRKLLPVPKISVNRNLGFWLCETRKGNLKHGLEFKRFFAGTPD